jgi:hypothetical protein
MHWFAVNSCVAVFLLQSSVSCLAIEPQLDATGTLDNPFSGKFLVLNANYRLREVFSEVRIVALGGTPFLVLPPVAATSSHGLPLPKHQTFYRLSAMEDIPFFDDQKAAERFAEEYNAGERARWPKPDLLPVRKHLPQPPSAYTNFDGTFVAVHCGQIQPHVVTDNLKVHQVGHDAFFSASSSLSTNSHRTLQSLSAVDRIVIFDTLSDVKLMYRMRSAEPNSPATDRSMSQP